MRIKWIDPDFRREAKTDHRCCVCGKALKAGKKFRTVLTSIADDPLFYRAIHSADYSEAPANLVQLPIGNDCAAQFGLEWSTEQSQWRTNQSLPNI